MHALPITWNSYTLTLSMHLTKSNGWLCKNGSAYAANGGVDNNVLRCFLTL